MALEDPGCLAPSHRFSHAHPPPPSMDSMNCVLGDATLLYFDFAVSWNTLLPLQVTSSFLTLKTQHHNVTSIGKASPHPHNSPSSPRIVSDSFLYAPNLISSMIISTKLYFLNSAISPSPTIFWPSFVRDNQDEKDQSLTRQKLRLLSFIKKCLLNKIEII